MKLPKRKKGAMVLLLVNVIGIASIFTANRYLQNASAEHKIALGEAEGFRAHMLAKAGFLGGLGALKKIPEDFLYQSGIALDPPPIPLGGGIIYYNMLPEDGKININSLVKPYDQQTNQRVMEMTSRLFLQLGLRKEYLFPVIDWLDENSQETGGGAEKYYYSGLKPRRKIKNGPMFSLSELLGVKGFDRKILYESLKTDDVKNNRSAAFQTEEERLLISDKDFILANNITAYLPVSDSYDDRININAAPYHVLMSLSDFMTREAVLKITKLRLKNGGYIKEVTDLKDEPEFQARTSAGLNLYKELAGEGTDVSGGRIKTKGEIYRIVGVGMVKNKVVRKVTGIFDLTNNLMLYYTED